MSGRPKHAVKRLNYWELADVKVPRIACNGSRNRMTTSSTSSKLYRPTIFERDKENSSVKVRYIGLGEDLMNGEQKRILLILKMVIILAPA